MMRERRGWTFSDCGRHARSAAVVLLAIGLLARFSSVAASDPLDPHITGLEPFISWSGNPTVPTMGWPFSLSATVDRSMPGWVEGKVFETTDGDRSLATCWYPTCQASVPADPVADMAYPRDRTFRYELFSRSSSYDLREVTVHQRKLWIGLTGDFGWSPGTFRVRLSFSPGGTGLRTYVYDNGSPVANCDVYFTGCNASVTAGHVYYGIVRDSTGNIFGVSPSYTATSGTTGIEETENDADLVRVGLLFASTTDVCDLLLGYPGTHVASSSASDQWLACDAAVTSSYTMPQLLRAVATAGGGTAVLWWLTFNQTVATTQPFEAPYFEVPTALPQAWPVDDVADGFMLQTRGKEIAQDVAVTAAGACLWWASRADINGRSACKTMPIFFTGADVNSATTHDARQIFAHPEWAKLNYEYGTTKPGSGWQLRQENCLGDPPEEGMQCDEFPFFSSEQGGPLARPTPHVQYIERIDNTRQGGFYSAFIRACELRTGTPQEGANSTGGTAFLVIPLMPALHIPTFWLCNRR